MLNRVYPDIFRIRLFNIILILASLSAIWTLLSWNREEAIVLSPLSPSSPLKPVHRYKNLSDYLAHLDLNETNVKTHKGYVILNEVNEKVFKPFGYEIIEPTLPVPTVRMLNEPTCPLVFSESLRISQQPQPEVPPEEIPEIHSKKFLMNGYAASTERYQNDRSTKGDAPKNWNRISEFINFSKAELIKLADKKESGSVYHAMSDYRLDGMSGIVHGSRQPWVEVMALKNGASRILTVESNSLVIQREFRNRLSSITPVGFAKNWRRYAGTFDFAASFSYIQNAGLGRYGDPIDPTGDLREMLKIRCMLRKGGLLFLGVPFGTDAIQFNAQRIYGSIRLSMMFYGFEWLATYSGDSEEPIDLTSTLLHSKGLNQSIEYTVVLKKL